MKSLQNIQRAVVFIFLTMMLTSCISHPVFDTNYKTILYDPVLVTLAGRTFVLSGYYTKLLWAHYNFHPFESNWRYETEQVLNDRVFEVVPPESVLKLRLGREQFGFKVHLDEPGIKDLGSVNTAEILRQQRSYATFDDRLYVLAGKSDAGNQEKADVWSSQDLLTWTKELDTAPWVNGKTRNDALFVQFQDKLYAVGGSQDEDDNLWRTGDGKKWEKTADFSATDRYVQVFEFKHKLFVLTRDKNSNHKLQSSVDGVHWLAHPGYPASQTLTLTALEEVLLATNGSQVFSSPDGDQWTQTADCTDLPSPIVRQGSSLTWFDFEGGTGFWNSSDGVEWISQLTGKTNTYRPHDLGAASTHNYNEYEIVQHQNQLWLIGESPDRIYKSGNGLDWTQVQVHPDHRFLPRAKAGITSFGGYLWIIGGVWIGPIPEGTSNKYIELNDVWRSSDGKSWEKMIENGPWARSRSPVLHSFNGYLYVYGKSNGLEIWKSTDGVSWKSVSTAAYALRGGYKPRMSMAGILDHQGQRYLFDRYLDDELIAITPEDRLQSGRFKERGSFSTVVPLGSGEGYLAKEGGDLYHSYDVLDWKKLEMVVRSAPKNLDLRSLTPVFLNGNLSLLRVDFNNGAVITSFKAVIDHKKDRVTVLN